MKLLGISKSTNGSVLLTGFSGFIGPHVSRALIEQGIHVVAVVRSLNRRSEAISQQQGIDLEIGDLADANFVAGIETKPFCIIHLAANSGRTTSDTADLYRDNVLSTVNLLELAANRNCSKFIYASSVSVFGEIAVSPLKRSNVPQASSPYGRSKLMAEDFLRSRGSGIGRVALQLPGVLGPGAPNHLLTSLVRKAIQGDEITLWNGNSLFNNVLNVSDLSRFIVKLALKASDPTFDAFPLASSDAIRMKEVVELIKLRAMSSSPVREVSLKKKSFFIDDEYARSVFGYESLTTREAIAQFVDSRLKK